MKASSAVASFTHLSNSVIPLLLDIASCFLPSSVAEDTRHPLTDFVGVLSAFSAWSCSAYTDGKAQAGQ